MMTQLNGKDIRHSNPIELELLEALLDTEEDSRRQRDRRFFP
jgi:hypothetical protein